MTIEDKAREYAEQQVNIKRTVEWEPKELFNLCMADYKAGASLAIEFADWIRQNYHINDNEEYCYIGDAGDEYTSSELFTMFLNREQ